MSNGRSARTARKQLRDDGMDRDWPHLDTALSTPASSSTMRLCDRKDFCCDHNEYPFLYPCKKMRLPNRLLSMFHSVFIMKKFKPILIDHLHRSSMTGRPHSRGSPQSRSPTMRSVNSKSSRKSKFHNFPIQCPPTPHSQIPPPHLSSNSESFALFVAQHVALHLP